MRSPAGDEVRVLPYEALRLLGKLKAELVREPDRAQEPQRVVFEDRLRDRAKNPRLEVGCSAERIHRLAPPQRAGDRVDREVAAGEVGFDPVGQRCEIHGATVVESDAPGAVPLRERERSSSRASGVFPRRALRVAAGDVEIDELSPEQLVSHCSADDPGLLALQQLLRQLMHR